MIGNFNQLDSISLFEASNSITSALANEFTEAVGDLYTSALIELGLILFLITSIVLAASKIMLSRLARVEPDRVRASTHLLGAKDVLFAWLTGSAATDPSTATGFGCFEIGRAHV